MSEKPQKEIKDMTKEELEAKFRKYEESRSELYEAFGVEKANPENKGKEGQIAQKYNVVCLQELSFLEEFAEHHRDLFKEVVKNPDDIKRDLGDKIHFFERQGGKLPEEEQAEDVASVKSADVSVHRPPSVQSLQRGVSDPEVRSQHSSPDSDEFRTVRSGSSAASSVSASSASRKSVAEQQSQKLVREGEDSSHHNFGKVSSATSSRSSSTSERGSSHLSEEALRTQEEQLEGQRAMAHQEALRKWAATSGRSGTPYEAVTRVDPTVLQSQHPEAIEGHQERRVSPESESSMSFEERGSSEGSQQHHEPYGEKTEGEISYESQENEEYYGRRIQVFAVDGNEFGNGYLETAIRDHIANGKDDDPIHDMPVSALNEELEKVDYNEVVETVAQRIQQDLNDGTLKNLRPKPSGKKTQYEHNGATLEEEIDKDGMVHFEPGEGLDVVVRVQRRDERNRLIRDSYDTIEYKNGQVAAIILGDRGESRLADLDQMLDYVHNSGIEVVALQPKEVHHSETRSERHEEEETRSEASFKSAKSRFSMLPEAEEAEFEVRAPSTPRVVNKVEPGKGGHGR